MDPDLEETLPFWRRSSTILALLIVAAAAIGLFLVSGYGQSINEPPRIQYASLSLHQYSSLGKNAGDAGDLKDEKGPFYGMVAYLGAQGLQRIVPGWKFLDGWHYMSFLAFVMGVYFFYRLCRRLIQPGPALAATLLFATQPLLWGHAFINPKDIPFMAFFLGSVTLGLEMVDHSLRQPPGQGDGVSFRGRLAALLSQFSADWRSAILHQRRLLTTLAVSLAVLAASFYPIRWGLAWLVEQAYRSSPATLLGQVFQQVAQHSQGVSVAAYVAKAYTLQLWLSLLVAAGLLLALIWVGRAVFPSTLGRLLGFLAQPRVILAGCFLGFASDIRTLGPAAGLLVAVYFLVKAGRRAIPVVLEYGLVGALTTFIFWPYLWRNPVSNFLASLSQAADYPYDGQNLFAGKLYPIQNTPAYYLPATFALQFTETALALFVIGLGLALMYFWKRSGPRLDLLLLGAWFVAPVAAAILLHSTLYNNFRQFLFVVPPLFVIAGLGLQAFSGWLRHRSILFVPLVALALAPALYWDVHLHPYQYIYYNGLAGGVSGSYQNYEGDYWFVSDKEAIETINRVAPPGATVYFSRYDTTALPYIRPDLQRVTSVRDHPDRLQNFKAGYILISMGQAGDKPLFPASPTVSQVSRDGNILAIVKQVRPGDLIQAR